MSKLFIQPRHGYLGKTIDELRAEKKEVEVIGWGYPPIVVEASDDAERTGIQEIAQDIDPEVKFQPYRVDQLTTDDILDILNKFTYGELTQLCVGLNIDRESMVDRGGTKPILVAGITEYAKNNNILSDLIEACHRRKPNIF